MPRAGLSRDAVVDHALGLVDRKGPEALTLAAVAQAAGVSTPSLYKHVGGLEELRTLLSVRVLDELSGRVAGAVLGHSRDEALRRLMRAYRGYVVDHPHRYAALVQRPRPGTAEAGDRLLRVLTDSLRGYGLDEDDTVHVARCVRSAAHGFAVLEAAGGFQLAQGLDRSYELLVDMVLAGLPRPDHGGGAGA
ncbi:WHG domain-containing protein [Streptomyces sp. NPDC005438]|uniref:TetR/AcrR family transcriptional regulator n=1 Tax=Streptomyces sp. NPDC005438 TaxID=3156880 RepID=UPI0033BEE99D